MVIKFFNDMIHMTENEFFLEYWWIWLPLTAVIVIAAILTTRRANK